MKVFLLLLTGLLFLDPACRGTEPKLPDFSRAFSEARLINRIQIEGAETYLFATNSTLDLLKTELQKQLGKSWKEKTFPPSHREKLKSGLDEKEKSLIDSTTIFENPEFPNLQISLNLTAVDEESGTGGKKSVAGIIISRKKVEGKEDHTRP